MRKETPSERKARYKREKQLDLIGWSYRTLKANAKRRGKAFSLTREEFEQFCYETELLTKRGLKNKAYTVDRINNEYGYHIGNIQRMEFGTNRIKSARLDYDWETKTARVIPYQELDAGEYPF